MSECSSGSCGGTPGKQSAKLKIQDEMIRSTLEKIKYKLFIMSGKGGVGKSSVSVNVAAALAARGFQGRSHGR